MFTLYDFFLPSKTTTRHDTLDRIRRSTTTCFAGGAKVFLVLSNRIHQHIQMDNICKHTGSVLFVQGAWLHLDFLPMARPGLPVQILACFYFHTLYFYGKTKIQSFKMYTVVYTLLYLYLNISTEASKNSFIHAETRPLLFQTILTLALLYLRKGLVSLESAPKSKSVFSNGQVATHGFPRKRRNREREMSKKGV